MSCSLIVFLRVGALLRKQETFFFGMNRGHIAVSLSLVSRIRLKSLRLVTMVIVWPMLHLAPIMNRNDILRLTSARGYVGARA
jgi:hypothetical protein